MATGNVSADTTIPESHRPWYKNLSVWALIISLVFPIGGVVVGTVTGCFGLYIDARDKIKEFDKVVAIQAQQATAIQALDQRLRIMEGSKASAITADERKQLRESDAAIRTLRGQISGLELNERKLNEQFEVMKEAVRALAK